MSKDQDHSITYTYAAEILGVSRDDVALLVKNNVLKNVTNRNNRLNPQSVDRVKKNGNYKAILKKLKNN